MRLPDGETGHSPDQGTSRELHNLVEAITHRVLDDVRTSLATSWDVSQLDVEQGIRDYSSTLVHAVDAQSFEPLRMFVEGMDSYWRAEEFAISPIIDCMFHIEDAALTEWRPDDAAEYARIQDTIREYTRRVISLLSERSISIVMERLQSEVEDHREGERRLLSLQCVSASMVSDLDQDRTLQLIADEARRLTGADGVVIRTADEHGDLAFAIGSGNEGLFMRAIPLPSIHSLSGEALRTRTPFCVDDIRSDPRVNRTYLNVSDSRSLLVVPLVARERPIGVIAGMSTQVGAFSE